MNKEEEGRILQRGNNVLSKGRTEKNIIHFAKVYHA